MNAGDARVYDDELARMQRVQRNFVAIEYAEVVFLVLSALAAVALKRQPVVVGIALGIVVNAAFLLGFDLVAERRGAIYLFAIERHAERPPTTR
jgi:hypothetical protein